MWRANKEEGKTQIEIAANVERVKSTVNAYASTLDRHRVVGAGDRPRWAETWIENRPSAGRTARREREQKAVLREPAKIRELVETDAESAKGLAQAVASSDP